MGKYVGVWGGVGKFVGVWESLLGCGEVLREVWKSVGGGVGKYVGVWGGVGKLVGVWGSIEGGVEKCVGEV